MNSLLEQYAEAIARSGLSIYDPIEVGDPELWIPSSELEALLDMGLRGFSLKGLALRTRSKVLKERVCKILGYPIPTSFKKSRPRFPGQTFDTFIQKSNNLQVWNDELSPSRRYVIIRVSTDDIIEKVKVVTGDSLAKLDRTGTLTQKYQAKLKIGREVFELISPVDTTNLRPCLQLRERPSSFWHSPTENPSQKVLLPIETIFERLVSLVGKSFVDVGPDQERNRGAGLHRLVCQRLGYKNYKDDGRFPDIRNQLLEAKLQTSPTIDLGLVCPDSKETLDIPQINGRQI